MLFAVEYVLLGTRHHDDVGVVGGAVREADVHLVIVHDLADGATAGADETRVDAVVDHHLLSQHVLLQGEELV